MNSVSSHDGTRQLPPAVRMTHRTSPAKAYDFLLKFLLVGDSDVGKGEILASLQDGATESPYGYNMGECEHRGTGGVNDCSFVEKPSENGKSTKEIQIALGEDWLYARPATFTHSFLRRAVSDTPAWTPSLEQSRKNVFIVSKSFHAQDSLNRPSL